MKAICLIMAMLICSSTHALTLEAQIDKSASNAAAAYSEFMQASSSERMEFELLGRAIDAATAQRLAEKSAFAARQFAEIAAAQDATRITIEDYQGQDWEEKYGSTGLWRRLKAEICRCQMFECQTRYWLARAASPDNSSRLMQDVSSRIEAFGAEFTGNELKLLEARVLCAAKRDSAEWQKGIEILDGLSELKGTISIEARLLRYLAADQQDIHELSRIWQAVKAEKGTTYEIWLRAGFAGWQRGQQGWLEEVERQWPATDKLLGRCVLAEAESRMKNEGVLWMGPYAANIAAYAAMSDIEKHRPIIEAMSKVREYRGTGVLLAMSASVEGKEPLRSAAYLIEAGSKMDEPAATSTLEKAAMLAYDEFGRNKSCCSEAGRVITAYLNIAREPKAEMMYCRYLIAVECGDPNDSRKWLERTAAMPAGVYQRRAKRILGVIEVGQALESGLVTKAANSLVSSIDVADENDVPLALDISAQFLAQWEQYAAQESGGDAGLRNCAVLTGFCAKWATGPTRRQAGILAAEAAVLQGVIPDDSTSIEKAAASDEDASRCMARVLMAYGDWPAAGARWGGICERKIAESNGDSRSWQWWRAKYYQLYCWSKGKDATREELARRVAITLSSCGPVPPLWEAKLKAL